MNGKILGYGVAAALAAAIFTGRADVQERTPVTGLEADSVYMSLVTQEEELKYKEDSLNARVAETRGLFRTDPDNRQRYSEDIIRLEGEIFDIRNLIGIVAGRLNTIEQEYIIRNLSDGGGPRPGGRRERQGEYPENSAMLVNNPLFGENLSPEDYDILLQAQRKEAEVVESIGIFAKNYTAITRLAMENELVDTPQAADSIYRLYETLSGLNERVAEKVAEDFGFVYDNKLYCYNFILDKLGRRNQLSSFEKKIAETRERALAAAEGTQSAGIAAYPYRKGLLFEYEEALARMAGYGRSLDSLQKARTALGEIAFDFPAVRVEEKLFLDYADLEFHNPAKYNSRNPVPDITVHPKGEIYRVLLGSYPRVQAVTVLKGAYPVGVLKEQGRFSYYAGGFATIEEAAGAMETLKGKGFRDLKIGRWENGSLTVMGQPEIDRALGLATEGLFRVSIDTGGKPLPDQVKEIVDDLFPDAEISRSGDLYIIGTFDSRDDACELADEIGDTVRDVEVKIEVVG